MIIKSRFPIPSELKESYDEHYMRPLFYTNIFRKDAEKPMVLSSFISWLKLKMGKKGINKA